MKANKKISKRKLIALGFWAFVLVVMLVLLPLTNAQDKMVICDKINIEILPKSNLFFVDNDDVLGMLKEANNGNSLIGERFQNINLHVLEKELRNNEFLLEANVYSRMTGELYVIAKQKVPVVRIINKYGATYYLDKYLNKIPFNEEYSPRLVVANGNISEKFSDSASAKSENLKGIGKVVQYIVQNELWRAQIEQVYVDKLGLIHLIPKIGNHTIVIGSANDLEEKFNRLKLFYKEGLSRVGWDKYKQIDLRFKNQVLVKKR